MLSVFLHKSHRTDFGIFTEQNVLHTVQRKEISWKISSVTAAQTRAWCRLSVTLRLRAAKMWGDTSWEKREEAEEKQSRWNRGRVDLSREGNESSAGGVRISKWHYVLAKAFLFLLILPTSMYCIAAGNVSADTTARIPLMYSHYGVLSQNFGVALIKQQDQGLTEALMGDEGWDAAI